MIDKRKVKKVSIDDFAIKRGQRYGSIMIDLETHKVVDMLNSREPEKVEKWLKGYENIQMVSRDGSISYKKAIKGDRESPSRCHSDIGWVPFNKKSNGFLQRVHLSKVQYLFSCWRNKRSGL